ncbi:MAG: signal peptide peptidase SppA [Phycisphaerales bacterium]
MHTRTPAALIVLLAVAAASVGCVPRSITISLDDRAGPVRETRVINQRGSDKVALIDLEGIIGPTGGFDAGISIDDLAAKLDHAAADRRVRAVLLRVNSPGGSVAASETLLDLIHRYKHRTGNPVVVSMGEVAASGGYYIATAADTIVAQPGTVTGSIGVIIPTINAADGMSRIGIVSRAVTSGPNKDLASPLEPIDEEHYAILQSMVDDFYAQFRDLVLARRPDITDPDTVLDGRVMTGTQALRAGLVDELGSLHDAFDTARRQAGLEHADLVKLHRSATRPLTPYASAEAPHTPIAAPPFSLPTIKRPAGSGAYYLWLAPGALASPR